MPEKTGILTFRNRILSYPCGSVLAAVQANVYGIATEVASGDHEIIYPQSKTRHRTGLEINKIQIVNNLIAFDLQALSLLLLYLFATKLACRW